MSDGRSRGGSRALMRARAATDPAGIVGLGRRSGGGAWDSPGVTGAGTEPLGIEGRGAEAD